MRGLYSSKTEIRHKIFTEIARMAYEGQSPEMLEELPYKIVPGEIATYRDSIFLERAVVGERLRVAMGMSLRKVTEHAPISKGVEASVIEEKYYEPPLINVIKFACNSCPENAKEIAGHGSVITIDNSEILAGNKKLMAQYHVTGDYPETTSYGTEVFLAKDGVLIGAIVIADTLKDDAKSAIASLKAQNLHTVMLTGDSETTANAIAKETGIDEVYSRLLPDEKLAKLQEQRSKHGAVMFVGDGINDAPVLAGADCGAAMGSGADAAIEAADVVFMTSNVEAIPQAISIGKKACKIAWQNVVFALAIKALVMILGLLGFANMWMAVFADSGVAMLCVINSIRAMKL